MAGPRTIDDIVSKETIDDIDMVLEKLKEAEAIINRLAGSEETNTMKALLSKYMEHVLAEEGVAFVPRLPGSYCGGPDWTAEEIAVLEETLESIVE